MAAGTGVVDERHLSFAVQLEVIEGVPLGPVVPLCPSERGQGGGNYPRHPSAERLVAERRGEVLVAKTRPEMTVVNEESSVGDGGVRVR